jgi:prephenate dehydrogenase
VSHLPHALSFAFAQTIADDTESELGAWRWRQAVIGT